MLRVPLPGPLRGGPPSRAR